MIKLSKYQEAVIGWVRTHVEKIETAIEPSFQQHFVHAMALPHGVDRFPELAKQVKLPEPKNVSDDGSGGRKGRRRKRSAARR